MRIGMLLTNQVYPPDIRIDKEADMLAAGGHHCLLLCKSQASRAAHESGEHVEIVRVGVYPQSTFLRKLDSLRFLLTLDSPAWRRAMMDLVRVHGAEALHVHDLPYVRSALRAGCETGVPVVLDLHENWPAALRLYRRRFIDRLLFSPARAARLERWALPRVDHIIVVVDEARERVVGLGTDPQRVTVFSNMEPRALAEAEAPPLAAGELELVYVGGIACHRGLEQVIEAMPLILAQRPEARLTIVGQGDALDELKGLARQLGVADAVEFTGWLPLARAMEYVARSSVALVPHHRSPHTDATIPHKLFQYMSLERPVLVSDCLPLARVVRDADCGEVFVDGDSADLAAKALVLARPERARAAAANGRAAVLDRYHMELDGEALRAAYDALGRQQP